MPELKPLKGKKCASTFRFINKLIKDTETWNILSWNPETCTVDLEHNEAMVDLRRGGWNEEFDMGEKAARMGAVAAGDDLRGTIWVEGDFPIPDTEIESMESFMSRCGLGDEDEENGDEEALIHTHGNMYHVHFRCKYPEFMKALGGV